MIILKCLVILAVYTDSFKHFATADFQNVLDYIPGLSCPEGCKEKWYVIFCQPKWQSTDPVIAVFRYNPVP